MRKPAGLFIFLGLGIYGWIEFEALIFVGNAIGGFLSFIGIFLTAFIGLFLIRKLNKRVFAAWQKDRENNNKDPINYTDVCGYYCIPENNHSNTFVI